ncbi:adenosine receptor A2b [Amblyraja radiata]|uniref:adenosine receptor A2b n=1 Tax=Amblyraja radiata TaxID=386614 RepID=UPI001401DC22|nr:adenosine receptor A2b [Amblyraja radiata]
MGVLLSPADWLYVGLELAMAVLAVLGNVLVCWAVATNSSLRTGTNYFLVSLAVADVAVGAFAIPFAITISLALPIPSHPCRFLACFVLVLTQSSIFSLLGVAIDRYLAVSIHLRYSGLITGRRARLIIAIFWILSFFIGLTPFLGWSQSQSPSKKADVVGCGNASAARGSHLHPAGSDSCPRNTTHECHFLNVVDMQYMIYFNFLGCVLTPLLLMLVIYVKIFTVARRQLQKIELSSVGSDSSRTLLQNQVRVAKSLSVIVGFFAFCWLPLHTINCVYYFHPRLFHDMGSEMIDAAIILSHANSVGNPIIYAYKIREFRNTFRKIISQQILRREGSSYENDTFYSSSPQTLKAQSC